MANPHVRSEEQFFSLPQAKWVVGVLSMAIAVVGRETLLGLILRQARSEVAGIVRDEEAPGADPAQVARAARYENN
jgi:hypothetical protein